MKLQKCIYPKALISDIFCSYQGEGIYFAEPQIFVRFYGCNISCNYCDTLSKNKVPYSTERLLEKIKLLAGNAKKDNISISLTGGEPLLWKEFLLLVLPDLRKLGFKILLETNGILYKSLKEIISLIDIVSMDIKLPSGCNKNYWEDHKKFLMICKDKSYIKLVITRNTKNYEVSKAVDLINSVSNRIPFVFQPVTTPKISEKPSEKNIDKWMGIAKTKLRNVHLIPQMHKIWKIR